MIKIAATKPVRLFFAGALALSMSSAAAITASANQAYAETDDSYTYCYAGLSWAEYWANEGVYNATDTSSSDELDSRNELDLGGFDAVTRATSNHGLHRGSFQCNATIHATATDGSGKTADFKVSKWIDANSFTTTDGKTIGYAKGVCTDADGTVYDLTSYDVYGTKYVPIKVKTSDFEAFKANRKEAGYAVVENGEALAGGYSEGNLKSYDATAEVNENTHGIKTATKNADDSFDFSAADETLTGSGIKDQDLKKVTETTKEEYASAADKTGKVYPIVGSLAGGSFSLGTYGEMIRVDIDGDYGDLGSAMQSVTWTYYGDDSMGTKVVRSFGTKFAADNWMHKSNRIQLGLTKSARCQFPDGYDGTGYWKITVHALGYEDYTTSLFSISSANIADGALVSNETKQKLQSAYDSAVALKESDYTIKSWSNLQIELDEADSLLLNSKATEAACSEQIQHVTEAVNSLVKAAQLPAAVSGLKYNGKAQTGVKGGSNVSITGNTATNAGSYKATVTPAEGTAWADGSTAAKTVSYTIAKANQSLTAKASTKTVKKAKVKKKAQKVSGAIKVTGAQGKVTYAKKSGSAKLKVASNGKITVKKKTKKGTYKVKVVVKAAGNGNYNAATKTVTVKVKVK